MEKKEKVIWFVVTGVGMVATIVGGRKVLSKDSFKAVVTTMVGITQDLLS